MQARLEPETTETEAAQRRRAAAAFVLITASLAVGILIGRLSASVMPGESPRAETSAAKSTSPVSQPPKPLAAAVPAPSPPTAAPPQPASQPAQPSPSPSQPPKLALTKDLAAAENVAPPNMQVISAAIGDPAASTAQDADAGSAGAADSKVSVINPGAGEAARETGKARAADNRSGSAPEQQVAADARRLESRYSAGGVEECERRYSSFRREDGTYQPYGGGPRMRCPHLR